MKLLRKLVQHTRKEPGVLVSQAYRSQREPRHCFVYLQFTDQTVADDHRGSAYYGEYLYGMHYCFNVVTGQKGMGRALGSYHQMWHLMNTTKSKARLTIDSLTHLCYDKQQELLLQTSFHAHSGSMRLY